MRPLFTCIAFITSLKLCATEEVLMGCPPGYFRRNSSSEECRPCEDGTFKETYNRQDGCTQCTPCAGGKKEISKCNATSNRRCKCPDNSFENTDGSCTTNTALAMTDDMKQFIEHVNMKLLQFKYNNTSEVCLSLMSFVNETMTSFAEKFAAGSIIKPDSVTSAKEESTRATCDLCSWEYAQTTFNILTFLITLLNFIFLLRKGNPQHNKKSDTDQKEKEQGSERRPLLGSTHSDGGISTDTGQGAGTDQTQGISTATVHDQHHAGSSRVVLTTTSPNVWYTSGAGPPPGAQVASGNVANAAVAGPAQAAPVVSTQATSGAAPSQSVVSAPMISTPVVSTNATHGVGLPTSIQIGSANAGNPAGIPMSIQVGSSSASNTAVASLAPALPPPSTISIFGSGIPQGAYAAPGNIAQGTGPSQVAPAFPTNLTAASANAPQGLAHTPPPTSSITTTGSGTPQRVHATPGNIARGTASLNAAPGVIQTVHGSATTVGQGSVAN